MKLSIWTCAATLAWSTVALADHELSFSPDGKRVAGSDFSRTYVWDLSSDKLVLAVDGTREFAGEHMVGLSLGSVMADKRGLEVYSGTGVYEKTCKGAFAPPLAVRPDGKRVVARLDDPQHLWKLVAIDVDTCKITPYTGLDASLVDLLSYSPDGKLLAYAYGSGQRHTMNKMAIIDADTGAERASVVEEQKGRDLPANGRSTCPANVTCLLGTSAFGWMPDGRLLAAGWDRNATALWTLDPRGGKPTLSRALQRPPALGGTGTDDTRVLSLVMSPDGKWLGVGSDDALIWYRYPSLELSSTWRADDRLHNVWTSKYSRDGKLIVVSTTGGSCRTCDHSPDVIAFDANASSAKIVHEYPTKDLGFKTIGPDTVATTKETPPPPETKQARKPLSGDQKEAMQKLEQAASMAAVWLGKFANPDDWKRELASTDLMKTALDQGNACHAAVAAARAAGIRDDELVDFNTYDSGVPKPDTVANVDAKLCRAAIDQASARVGAQADAKEALYAPYLKALSGDKAKVFAGLSPGLPDIVDCARRCSGYYGHGMRRLKTPADFASSDVWYYYVIHRDTSPATWEVQGWRWSGMSKAGGYSKKGAGEDPPASAFE